jgi:hypothetical protein
VLAFTVEFKIVNQSRTEAPLILPPVPIPAPVHVVDALTTLSTIPTFPTTDEPESTFPPPIAAPPYAFSSVPVVEATAVIVPLRMCKVPRNVELPARAGPAPIPVPPVATIEPFRISSDSHLPFGVVPTPEALVPAIAVSEPPPIVAMLTFDDPAHSSPLEEAVVLVSEFAPSKTTVTELSEMTNGHSLERETYESMTVREPPWIKI